MRSADKGMWMGDSTPTGYRIEYKKLVPDPHSAEIVRSIFRRYLNVRSYVGASDGENGKTAGMRLPADRFERAILTSLANFLADASRVARAVHQEDLAAGTVGRAVIAAKDLAMRVDVAMEPSSRDVIRRLLQLATIASPVDSHGPIATRLGG